MCKKLVNIHAAMEVENRDLGLDVERPLRLRVVFFFDDGDNANVVFNDGTPLDEVIDSLRAFIEVLRSNKKTVAYRGKREAPWKDFHGNRLFEGDAIIHPDGDSGKIIFKDGPGLCDADKWFVDYGPEFKVLSRLCLQIGR